MIAQRCRVLDDAGCDDASAGAASCQAGNNDGLGGWTLGYDRFFPPRELTTDDN